MTSPSDLRALILCLKRRRGARGALLRFWPVTRQHRTAESGKRPVWRARPRETLWLAERRPFERWRRPRRAPKTPLTTKQPFDGFCASRQKTYEGSRSGLPSPAPAQDQLVWGWGAERRSTSVTQAFDSRVKPATTACTHSQCRIISALLQAGRGISKLPHFICSSPCTWIAPDSPCSVQP